MEATTYEQEFGRRIRAARQLRGLTLAQVAAAAGTSLNTVWRIEAGTRGCSLGLAARLAAALRVPLAPPPARKEKSGKSRSRP